MTVTVTHTTEATLPNDPTKEVSSDAWNEGHAVTGLGTAAESAVEDFEAAGTVATAITTHEAAANPHPGYLTQAESDGLYSVLAHTHNGLAPTAGTTGQVLKKSSNTNFDYAWATDETSEGGSEAFPVGSVFIAVVSTDPATLLGYGTWSAFGAGKVLIGLDSGDADFDTAEETGGAKTKAISAHGGTAVADHAAHTHGVTSNVAVADHASHTHQYTEIVQHTHTVNITDGGHTHTQISQTATSGSATTYEHGAVDTSSTGSAEGAVTGSSTTGITATTSNPAGSVATGTTVGPSATLTHSVTNNAVTSANPSATLTHSVTQPSAHTDLNVVQPYIVVYMWKRTA